MMRVLVLKINGMESQNNKSFEIVLYPGSKCFIVSEDFMKVIIEPIGNSKIDGNENEEK